MMKFMKDMLTEINGTDFDVSKLLWIVGVLSFVGYGGYHIWLNHVFDPIGYGTGLGAALAGGGAGVAWKSKEINNN